MERGCTVSNILDRGGKNETDVSFHTSMQPYGSGMC